MFFSVRRSCHCPCFSLPTPHPPHPPSALHAGSNFPPEGYLVSLSAVPATTRFCRFRYITFRNIEFAAERRAAGGLNVTQSEEIRISFCRFTGYTQLGIHSYGLVNELFIEHTWLNELNDDNQCHNVNNKTVCSVPCPRPSLR